jgi:hypothetical protein
MRDYLLDLVSHTYDLGCINLVKITGTDADTSIDGLAEDRSVVVQGKYSGPIADFIGSFGMPNLDKLKILLNLQEYREDAEITVRRQDRNGQEVPVGLHFKNAAGDLKTAKFLGAKWSLEFEPTVAAIARLRMQAQANSDIPNFRVKTENNELKFQFGDQSTHAGEFVFHSGASVTLKHAWAWPVQQVINILSLSGDKVMRISDEGAMQITVNSGLAVYDYILPAQSK